LAKVLVDKKLKEHLSDVLYRVPLNQGGNVLVYVLIEHKSYTDKWVALQLLRYLVQIWEDFRRNNKDQKLPFVFPIVFYHGRSGWTVSKKFSDLFEWEGETNYFSYLVPEFEYHLFDLTKYLDKDLIGYAPLAAALRLFRDIFRRDLRDKLPATFEILETEELSEKTRILALEKIDKNLRSQTRLVEELLNYSQIVSGTVEMENNEINFSEIFETVYSEVEPAAQIKNIEFVKDNQLNGQLILGDAGKMKTVIYNLLSNAVKFTEVGGRVEAAVRENEAMIQMAVRDDGKGISQEFLPHIFDRFTQADASSTRISGGLGLGLTVSSQIIKLHRGTITVNSAGIGEGAIFTIKIPRYDKPN